MEMLFGKAITAKGNKFMLDPKSKKAEKKTAFAKSKVLSSWIELNLIN